MILFHVSDILFNIYYSRVSNINADIDSDPDQAERTHAQKLMKSELSRESSSTLHSFLPPLPDLKFSELMQKEIDRKEAGQPMDGGIDLTRYEAADQPESESSVYVWRKSLKEAYTSSSYLSGRLINLSLLEEFGKNAWLISNSQLEDLLRDLEKELADQKAVTESVNKARKAIQEESRGELVNLEDTWKSGIGRIIEIQVATDGLRREILERRRHNAR